MIYINFSGKIYNYFSGIVSMLKKVLAILFIASTPAHAGQPIRNELHDLIWKIVSEFKGMSFNELTQNGQFAGCELVFRYPLRDYRQLSGEPILVTGAVTNVYWEGKAFNISLKIQPNRFEFNKNTSNIQLKTLTPKTASLVVGETNLKKFERASFECSDGGICQAYSDNGSATELLENIFDTVPFDATVLYSMSETGLDLKFKISEMDSSPAAPERLQFAECMQKSVQGLIEFYDEKPAKK
jgi:hypothetical protein